MVNSRDDLRYKYKDEPKMEKEFNFKGSLEDCLIYYAGGTKFLSERNVLIKFNEFIRLLKEKISNDYRLLEVSDNDILKEINKLVGGELNGKRI